MQKLNHFKFSITRNSQYIITPFHKSPNIFFILKQNSDKFKNLIAVIFKPTPEEIRTPDLLVRSQTLYPAELRALKNIIGNTYINKKRFFFKFFEKFLKNGNKINV